MPFTRVWDASCPKEYDRWEADGTTWVIQDLPPEDDEKALQLLVENLIPDEALCIATGLLDDEVSVTSMAHFWRLCLRRRTSLACYAFRGEGAPTLAAVNCCIVICADEHDDICERAWTPPATVATSVAGMAPVESYHTHLDILYAGQLGNLICKPKLADAEKTWCGELQQSRLFSEQES